MQTTSDNSCNAVLTRESLSLQTSGGMHKQVSHLQASSSLQPDTLYQVDKSITEAISQFPKPTWQTYLRPFFGLANQLSTSTDKVATLLEPLCPLLDTKNDFTWEDISGSQRITHDCSHSHLLWQLQTNTFNDRCKHDFIVIRWINNEYGSIWFQSTSKGGVVRCTFNSHCPKTKFRCERN